MENADLLPRSSDKRKKFEESSISKDRDAIGERGSFDRKHRSGRSRRRGRPEKESSVDATPSRDLNEDAPHRSEKEEVESIIWKTDDSRGRITKKSEKPEDPGDFCLGMKRGFEQGKTSTRRKQVKADSPVREEREREIETGRGIWLAKEGWVDSWESRGKLVYGDKVLEKLEAAATHDKGSGSHTDGTQRDTGSNRKFSEEKLGKKAAFHGEEEIKARGDAGGHYDDALNTIAGAKARREDSKPDREELAAQSLHVEHDRGRSKGRTGNENEFGPDRIIESGARWQQAENVSSSTDRKGNKDPARVGRLEKQGKQPERAHQEDAGDQKMEDSEEVRIARYAREEMWMDGQDTLFRKGDSLRTRRQSRWDESEVPKRLWHGRNEDGSGAGDVKSHRQKSRENVEISKDFYDDGNAAFKSGRTDRKKNYRDVGHTTREDFEAWERPYERKRDYREEDHKIDRSKANRDRVESGWEPAEDRTRPNAKLQDEDEELGIQGRAKDGLEPGWEDVEDRRRPGAGRLGKPGRGVKISWSPEGRRRVRGEYDEYDREWSDDRKDSERERGYRRDYDRERESYRERERDFQRERDRERDSFREKEFLRERDRTRDREDAEGRWKNRQRDRQKEKEVKNEDAGYYFEREGWDMHKRWVGRLDRERTQRTGEERDRMERERSDTLMKSSHNSGTMNDSMERCGGSQFNAVDSNRERTFASGQQFLMRRGDSGTYMGDFHGANGDVDWMAEERVRMGDGFQMVGDEFPERFLAEDEGPPGLDFAPNSSRMMGDGGTFYNMHGGRGRGAKESPGHRFRGGQMGNDGRLPFGGNQGSGMMMRGLQQGGKGGRGRGGAKGGRGTMRDPQRSGLIPPLMGPGPGPPGPAMAPHFGPLGPPPGPLPSPGPNMGLGPGPGMGPGGFPLPPFGGPIGWSGARGAGDMSMLPVLPGPAPVLASSPAPRFGPNMGPGPAPNIFFSPPGPGRGGPNGPPASVFGGASFGGHGAVPEKAPLSRIMPRITAPAGRAPSRGEQNDYSQHFVDTGLRPQNFIRDVELSDRFEEYPKLKELITRKDKVIADHATPPMYMQMDLHTTELTPEFFGTKFDVILVDPPWEEYVRRAPGVGDSMEWWPFEEIQNLQIEAIADTPSFIFLWVGDAEGLEQGRLCLKKWGFRRCEDICWVKTNRDNPTPALRHDASTILQHSKEHCLMGIKGTVRRSTDGHIIHANIDTDIIISEEPPYGSTSKPEELYHNIEHFALGQRRLELFGEDHNIRAGWVTVGKGLTSSNFNVQTYTKCFADSEGKLWQGGRGNPPVDAPHLVGTTPEIEALRPKSPPPRAAQQGSQAANSASQPSPPNPNAKRACATSPQNVQAAGNAVIVGSAGQATSNSSVIVLSSSSPVQGSGTGRGGGQGQIPKPRISPLSSDSKPPGVTDDKIEEDKTTGGDVHDNLADEVPRHAEPPADATV